MARSHSYQSLAMSHAHPRYFTFRSLVLASTKVKTKKKSKKLDFSTTPKRNRIREWVTAGEILAIPLRNWAHLHSQPVEVRVQPWIINDSQVLLHQIQPKLDKIIKK